MEHFGVHLKVFLAKASGSKDSKSFFSEWNTGTPKNRDRAIEIGGYGGEKSSTCYTRTTGSERGVEKKNINLMVEHWCSGVPLSLSLSLYSMYI